MYETENKKNSNKEFWGCVGIVGAALITGIFALIIALPTLVPLFRPTSTPVVVIVPVTLTPVAEVILAQNTPVIPPTVQATQPQPTIETILPTFTPDPSCMTISPFREMGELSETKTYIRCPVGQVEYSIQVDDTLNSIILSCPNQPDKNISFAKNEARSANELLITWDSESFRSEQGCKVKITITNNYAEMGYTVWQEVIAP
jgi:hypothetical protein